jgi:pimeloyl-ACP methyl ester carboxylesterase
MTGGHPGLAAAVRDTVATVDGRILHSRINAALTVDVTGELRRLTQPVLYVRAERDRLVPARCAAVVHAAKPSTEMSAVNGPHLLLQSRPVESWRVIAPFLERAFLCRRLTK